MNPMTLRIVLLLCVSAGIATSAACEVTDPTEASIANDFPKDDPSSYTLVKVWYRSTLFLDPVAPGDASESLRVASADPPPIHLSGLAIRYLDRAITNN